MILTDEEVKDRINSPSNLLNKLNRLVGTGTKTTGMEIFQPTFVGSPANVKPELSDESIRDILDSIKDNGSVDDVVENSEEKIKLGIIKSKALDVMHDSLVLLGNNLESVSKTEKLATVAREMKSILTDREDKNANKMNQVIVYKPIINDISKYEVLQVNE